MNKISAIQKQIEDDDGIPGSRARKNAKRASDANPVKGALESVEVEVEDAKVDSDMGLFSRLVNRSE